MLSWALTLFIVSIITAILGFGGVIEEATASAACRLSFFVFLIGFLVALVRGLSMPRQRREL